MIALWQQWTMGSCFSCPSFVTVEHFPLFAGQHRLIMFQLQHRPILLRRQGPQHPRLLELLLGPQRLLPILKHPHQLPEKLKVKPPLPLELLTPRDLQVLVILLGGHHLIAQQ